MYGLEIIGSIVICVFTSLLAFFLARKSLTQTEDIVHKEEIKTRSKTSKKSSKIKIAKKESGIILITKNDEEVVNVQPKSAKKEKKKAKTEVKLNTPTVSTDKIKVENSDDWKQVSKATKKISKKEIKDEIISELPESDAATPESITTTDKMTKLTKTKKPSKDETARLDLQSQNSKDTKKEAAKDLETKVKQNKESSIVNEVKQDNSSEEMTLRQRVGELMSDMDRQRNAHKEENKSHTQTINLLNKELDAIKQKMKLSQSNEEKLTEELKKRNSSFNDFKQQFVIVQSELTKNIVLGQGFLREKEKLENHIKSLEEMNKQLLEKSELFDRVNAEKENLHHRLTSVEDEYKATVSEYNELSKTKDVESTEKINQLQSDRQRLQEQLVRVQTDLIDNNSKLQNMQQELLNTKNTYTELLNENVRIQKSYAASENANVLIKQQQSSEICARDRENEERITELLKEIENLKIINSKVVADNDILTNQCTDVKSSQIEEKVESLIQELNHVNQLLLESKDSVSNQNDAHDKLVTEINELKIANAKLLASVEHYQTELGNKESVVLKLQSSFLEEETKWKESFRKLEMEAAKKEESLSQEIKDITDKLSQTSTDNDNHQKSTDDLIAELNELRREKDNLSSLVEHYKSGLENTESILSKLQISVNEEEAKWRESLLKSESEADKCSKELETVYNELMRIRNQRAEKSELNFAYHCVDRSLSSLIDEMEARMTHFERSLEEVIQERDSALAQMHVKITNGTADESEKVHCNNTNGSEHEDSEMTKIKEDLFNQIELNRSLETNCNKYRALIDIGKDALDAEKVHVQTLKEELMVLQNSLSTNSNDQQL